MTTKIVLSQISIPANTSVGAVVTVQSDGTLAANGFALPLVMDDISPQFDGTKTVFTLAVDTLTVSNVINSSILDSKDLDVSMGGQLVKPYVSQTTYPWLTPYDSFRQGYRVEGNSIVFFVAPSPGSDCSIIIRNISRTIQTRRYPFTAGGVVLGD
jgi:hypothetical protein